VGGRDRIGYASLGYELDRYRRRFVEYYNQLAQDRQKPEFVPAMIDGGGKRKLRLVEGKTGAKRSQLKSKKSALEKERVL
jgi:hypothetical protein